MENKNYAKLVDGNIEYAPRNFLENNNLIVPKQNDDMFYFSRGYFKVIDNEPYYDYETQNISILKWNVNKAKHTITSVYVVNENVIQTKQVRKFSKLKLTLFCIEQNIWKDVKEYLEKIRYYDLFVMAQYFLESDEYFIKGIESFKEAYCDENNTKEELDKLVEAMFNFAFDGYEIVDISTSEIQEYGKMF